jgi:type I restriction enzyme S subunit
MGDIMKENKNVPEIRFEGFEGEWEDNQFNNVAIYRNGRAHENDIEERGKYIVVNSKFVSTNGEVKKYSNKQNEPLYLGEIAFVLSDVPNGRAIARTFLVDANNKYTLNQRIAAITPTEETDSYFLYILLNRNKYFLQFDDGAKQTNLSKVDVENFLSYYPSKPEQSQIGTFFQNLDKQITLEQQKHDKLVTLKKAMLEKMFPKEGASVPEIRFEGFENPWIQKEIKELFKITRGEVLAATETSQVKTGFMTYPVYSSQTKNNGLMGYYHDYLFENAITWTTDGANAGTVKYRKGKFYSTNVNGVLLSDDGYANQAIAESINIIAWKHVSYVGNPKLMNNVMSKIKIYISDSLEEQQLISDYFNTFDTFISLQQQKIDKLKNIKKACLDKMFV